MRIDVYIIITPMKWENENNNIIHKFFSVLLFFFPGIIIYPNFLFYLFTFSLKDMMTCYTPFTIEDTFCGRQAEYILKSIEGWDSTCGPLNPTGSVCCRLLRRLGDVLMGIRDSSRSKLNQYFNSRKRGVTHLKRRVFYVW